MIGSKRTIEASHSELSVKTTMFFMKCVGFWMAKNDAELFRRKAAYTYTVFAVVFGIWIVIADFLHSTDNFNDFVYSACTLLTAMMVLYKIFFLSLNYKELISLISYADTHFWIPYEDNYEKEIVGQCNRKSTFFVCSFMFFAQCTVCCYALTPIIENRGRNESDRQLPFGMWINLPFSTTPYFEITFVMQVLSAYHIGICYFSFDNLLSMVNIYLTGQFRILQYRLSALCNQKNEHESSAQESQRTSENEVTRGDNSYQTLKKCIQQHQVLIEYCRKLERVFTYIILGQVLAFSVLICLVGFQVLLATSTPMRRSIFISHLMGTLCQLMMLTSSCDGLMRESAIIADASFGFPWYSLVPNKTGLNLRNDISFIIMRAQRPCCLTAGKFFAVSLETYTTVMSTATSYFTLLRQSSPDEPIT